MPITKESKLEKFIKDFVKTKTDEHVELLLQDSIYIRPVSKRGSTILGILWANVLQHENNFPREKYEYYKKYDEKVGEEQLLTTVSHVTFAVYLTTGTFSIASDYVYAWFTEYFKDVLTRYDPEFTSTWVYCPTKFKPKGSAETLDGVVDPNTPTESYLMLCNTVHQRDLTYEKRLSEGIDGLIVGVGDLSIHKSLWKNEGLDIVLEDLKQGGLHDSFNYIYKLYMSLLDRWFEQENTKIFISSPQVDVKILKEIIDLFLSSGTAPKGVVESFYLDFRCDGTNTAIEVKKHAIVSYAERLKAYTEYHILRKMVHTSPKVTGNFLAAVCDGKAEVLVASANLHSSHLHQHRMETAVFLTMTESDFRRKYIAPCATPSVSVTY